MIAYVIGSVPIMFVSAFAAWAFVGMDLAMNLDERFVAKGDEIHPLFKVVFEYQNDSRSFNYLGLRRLDQAQENLWTKQVDAPVSFLMSEQSGKLKINYEYVLYRVIQDHGQEQIIEVNWGDDTYETWSRYKATESTISPIWSRMFTFSTFGMGMLLVGFPFALIVYLAGRSLEKKLATPAEIETRETG